jgi:hypothetical protein
MTMKFENSVTLGNILTALSMALAGTAAWTNMSERIAHIEQKQLGAREADLRHEAAIAEMKKENRDVLLEIKTDIKEIRLDLKKAKP